MERVKGIEPSRLAWKARALPLSYTRLSPNTRISLTLSALPVNKTTTTNKPPTQKKWSGREDLNLRPPAPKAGALAKLRYAPQLKFN